MADFEQINLSWEVAASYSYIAELRKFLISKFGFWLVNTLLRKFDASSKKEMKMIKTLISLMKNKKK